MNLKINKLLIAFYLINKLRIKKESILNYNNFNLMKILKII